MTEEKYDLYDITIPKLVYNKLIQISEIYIKYISSYKSHTKDYIKSLKSIYKNYEEKMKSIKVECEKNKYYDLSIIFPILNSIPNVNNTFTESLQFSVNELEILIESQQKFIKERKIIYNKFFQNYNDAKKDLLMKMNDLEKEKNIFLNSLSTTEKNISEFYTNKIKIEDYSKEHNNTNNNSEVNELKNLFIQNSNLETQMEKSIKESKNIEKNYKSLVSNSKIFKKTFFFSSNITYENIKSISYEIIIEIKNLIQNIIILLKNSMTMPLKEIDTDLSKLIKNNDEYNKKFNNIFANLTDKISDQFPIEATKYSLKVFNSDSINHFIIEDEKSNDSNYIDNDLDYLIAKEMLSSFSLINEKYKINFELEDEKRTTNKIMSNLLCNIEENYRAKGMKDNTLIEMKDPNSENNNNTNDLKYVHENDIIQLYKLLNNHHNRAVCLQTLSHFRTLGKFSIPSKIFDIIEKCLLIIIDNVTKDEDYHMAKTVMVLSQTYFKIDDNNNRYYLQNVIKEHKLFKSMKFWEKSLDISLKNEINRIKNIKNENDENNKLNLDKDNIIEDDIEKYNDIAFGQIVSMVNSMIDFDINKEYIKQIIEPKIVEYKLNENHKLNINLVMDNKEEPTKKEKDKNDNNQQEKNEIININEQKEIKEENINTNEIKEEKKQEDINNINNKENNKSEQDNNINNIELNSEEKK